MNTIGYLFLLISGLLFRAVYKGRILNIGQDLSDAFTDIVSGDYKGLSEVLSRTGDANDPTVYDAPTVGAGASLAAIGAAVAGTGALAAEVYKLGSPAKGYRLGSTGPDYFDCSGLVWRACKNLGYYTGARFVVATFAAQAGSHFTRVDKPVADAVVLWYPHHMGVVTGEDTYYSAMSVRSGIGYSKISHTWKGITPQYYVFKEAEGK